MTKRQVLAPTLSRSEVQLLSRVVTMAASPSFLHDLREDLARTGIVTAIRAHDTKTLFSWIVSALSYQGISDSVATSYMDTHGRISANAVRSAIRSSPCPKLNGYWTFEGCDYRKDARRCGEPRLMRQCGLPDLPMRNGRLNQMAASLFLFIRDAMAGDIVSWLDERIRENSDPSAVIDAMRGIYGEHFLDTWGNELESMGSEATIAALGSLPLPSMRGFLRAANIPEHCLAAIVSFSVEDFEGVEDLELISTEIIEPNHIRIEYFFQLQTLIWTVEVSGDDYYQHGQDFREHFINASEEDGIASMELVQRCYFKAVTIFDRNRAEFSGVSITSSAIRPPRSTKRS